MRILNKFISHRIALALLVCCGNVVAAGAADTNVINNFYLRLQAKINDYVPKCYREPRDQKDARVIVMGTGWGAFRLYATRAEMVPVMGEPDPDSTARFLKWENYHISCWLDEEGRAFDLRFFPGFKYPLDPYAIKVGSPKVKVIGSFGVPRTIYRTGPDEELPYPSRHISFLAHGGEVTQIRIYAPEVKVADQKENIIENVGWGAFKFGKKRDQLAADLGEVSAESVDDCLYWNRQNIFCLMNPYVGAYILCFNRGCKARLSSGIGIGSTAEEVMHAYGPPDRISERAEIKKLLYVKGRLLFNCEYGRVVLIALMPPKYLSQMFAPIEEGSGWGAVYVGAAKEDVINIIGPPDVRSADNREMTWKSCHLTCRFDDKDVVKAVVLGRSFSFPMESGLKIGSTYADIVDVCGKPESTESLAEARKMLKYPSRGVKFELVDDKVQEITIIPRVKKDESRSKGFFGF